MAGPDALAPRAPSDYALSLRASHAGLANAQDRLEVHLGAAGVNAKSVRRLLLVVEEAVMNIAMHGGDSERLVRLELQLQPAHIIVTLQDDGPRFDPRDAPQPPHPANLSEAVPGGLGVHLMRTFAQAMHHEWRDGHNILRLTLARE